jgi:hypothetical protein
MIIIDYLSDKADLAVGSIKADLEEFKGLNNSFKIKDNEH